MPVDDLKRAVLLHELRNNGGKPDVDARVALNAILMAGSAPKHGLDDDERQELEKLVRQRPYDAEVIPAKFLLNSRDVTRVMRGASLHVIQPQSYDGITTLDNSSFMFGEDAGDGLGLFYRHTRFGEDGQEIAVSGSGADHWIKVSSDLLNHIRDVHKSSAKRSKLMRRWRRVHEAAERSQRYREVDDPLMLDVLRRHPDAVVEPYAELRKYKKPLKMMVSMLEPEHHRTYSYSYSRVETSNPDGSVTVMIDDNGERSVHTIHDLRRLKQRIASSEEMLGAKQRDMRRKFNKMVAAVGYIL